MVVNLPFGLTLTTTLCATGLRRDCIYTVNRWSARPLGSITPGYEELRDKPFKLEP